MKDSIQEAIIECILADENGAFAKLTNSNFVKNRVKITLREMFRKHNEELKDFGIIREVVRIPKGYEIEKICYSSEDAKIFKLIPITENESIKSDFNFKYPYGFIYRDRKRDIWCRSTSYSFAFDQIFLEYLAEKYISSSSHFSFLVSRMLRIDEE